MSRLDDLQLDADGFLAMDAFPVDAPDLTETDLVDLRDALLADPVEEPSADEWEVFLDHAVHAEPVGDAGPFALGDEGQATAETTANAAATDAVDDVAVDLDDTGSDGDGGLDQDVEEIGPQADPLLPDGAAGDVDADLAADDLIDLGDDPFPVDDIPDGVLPEAVPDAEDLF